MTEEDIEIRHHLVTSKELMAIIPANPTFIDIRETKYNAWKKFIDSKEVSDTHSKCPFIGKNKNE